MQQQELSPQLLERADTYKRRDLIVDLAQQYLKGTALVADKPWTPEDPEQVKNFLIAAAPFAHPKIFPSYWDHVVIASIYARKVAEKAPRLGLNPNEAEALESLHDIGRLAIPNRYLRNDLVEDSIFHRVHIRPQLLEKLPSVPKIIGVKVPFISRGAYRSIDDVPPIQRALDVTDNFGKRAENGELFDKKDHEEYSSKISARYQGGMWASERAGKKAYAGNIEMQRFANELLSAELKWLEEEYGIHFDQLRQEVARELQKPEHQQFLLDLKDAQETLNPNVDHLLGRPAIQAVVFDMGNVLTGGTNSEDIDLFLAQKLALHFGCSTEEAYKALLDSLADGKAFSGKISEEEYLVQFWQRLGKTPPVTIDELRAPFVQPEIYAPIEGMQEIVDALSKNSNIEILCLSDAIAAVTPPLLEAIKKYFPQIKLTNIILSNRVGATKKESGSPAFKVLLDQLGSPNPESVLFIDDKEDYTTAARATYNMRGFTFRGNPYKNLSATERLVAELKKAGLI